MLRLLIGSMLSLLLFDLNGQCISGNCMTGKGVFIFPSGGKYDGQFLEGKLMGKGIFYYTNGNVYTGDWQKNIRVGKGTLKMATGDTYTGDFKANVFWGYGIYKFSNGEIYEGEWYNDKAKGNGKYNFPTGEHYEGQFEDGKFTGYGKYIYTNKSVYEGEWLDNKRHGEGTYTDKNGTIQSGKWENDELVQRNNHEENKTPEELIAKPVSNYKINEDDYNRNCVLEFCDGGVGYYTYKDGSKWVGEFKEGKPQGSGTCYYSNGDRYEGEWQRNLPQGKGIMYLKTGEVYGGKWENGNLVREEEIAIKNTSEPEKPRSDKKINIWALVIGIGAYNHQPVLKYTDDDAYQVYAFLKSAEGGMLENKQIKLCIDENATKEKIEEGLNYIVDNADENDVIFIFYAGHGFKGSFVPYDFDGYNNLLSHDEVLKTLERSRAKDKVVIADACHSGSMIAQRSPFKSMLEEFYTDFEKSKGGTALIMSSKENENSLEYEGMRQGVFSYFLIQGLEGRADFDGNGIVDINEIYQYVNTNVRHYTDNNQNPLLAGDFDPKMPIAVVRSKFMEDNK